MIILVLRNEFDGITVTLSCTHDDDTRAGPYKVSYQSEDPAVSSVNKEIEFDDFDAARAAFVSYAFDEVDATSEEFR